MRVFVIFIFHEILNTSAQWLRLQMLAEHFDKLSASFNKPTKICFNRLNTSLPFGGVQTNIASGPIVQTDYG
jgi:hypothetical protein